MSAASNLPPEQTTAKARKAEGWFGPSGSKRFHYFDSDLRSLCGKWMLWAHPEDAGMEWGDAQTWNTTGDCAACAKKQEAVDAAS